MHLAWTTFRYRSEGVASHFDLFEYARRYLLGFLEGFGKGI